jgi:hypothetical protein
MLECLDLVFAIIKKEGGSIDLKKSRFPEKKTNCLCHRFAKKDIQPRVKDIFAISNYIKPRTAIENKKLLRPGELQKRIHTQNCVIRNDTTEV